MLWNLTGQDEVVIIFCYCQGRQGLQWNDWFDWERFLVRIDIPGYNEQTNKLIQCHEQNESNLKQLIGNEKNDCEIKSRVGFERTN